VWYPLQKKARRITIKQPEVTIDVWASLYAAAQKFKKLRVWEFMDDTEVFGVTDTVSGQINYCCVLGAGEEVFGLCAYRGSEGLDFYLRLISDELDPELDDIWATQNVLIVEYANRDEMEKEDLEIIKDLGLKFRGKNNYPRFRSHAPGYYPWFLDQDEAAFLTFAIECACDLGKQVKSNPDILIPPDDAQFLTYTMVENEGALSIKREWKTPVLPKKAENNDSQPNEIQLKRISKMNLKKDSAWEVGSFYTHSIITEGDRPFWMHLVMVAHQESGYILHMNPLEPEMSLIVTMRDCILNAIEKSSLVPDELLCRDEALIDHLQPIADFFGIKIFLVNELPAIQEAKSELSKASMMDFPRN